MVEPKRKIDRESHRRVVPLISLPPDELALAVDEKIVEGMEVPVLLTGKHLEDREMSLRLSRHPTMQSAGLLPGTALGVAEIAYSSSAGCCPYAGARAFWLFRYSPQGAPSGQSVELRVGPDYLAVVSGERRAQVSLPKGCGFEKNKGQSAKRMPFSIPCAKKATRLTVERRSDHVSVLAASVEVARLHVSAGDTLTIKAEEVVHGYWDGNAYTHNRLVCTYGGRCSHVIDSHLDFRLPGPTRPLCSEEKSCEPGAGGKSICDTNRLCLRVPKRKAQRETVTYEHYSRYAPPAIERHLLPQLGKHDRIIGVEWEEQRPNRTMVVIKNRKTGQETRLPLKHRQR